MSIGVSFINNKTKIIFEKTLSRITMRWPLNIGL
jgi:hypothetical protein